MDKPEGARVWVGVNGALANGDANMDKRYWDNRYVVISDADLAARDAYMERQGFDLGKEMAAKEGKRVCEGRSDSLCVGVNFIAANEASKCGQVVESHIRAIQYPGKGE